MEALVAGPCTHSHHLGIPYLQPWVIWQVAPSTAPGSQVRLVEHFSLRGGDGPALTSLDHNVCGMGGWGREILPSKSHLPGKRKKTLTRALLCPSSTSVSSPEEGSDQKHLIGR